MTELKKVTTLAWRRHLSSESGVEGMLFLRERIPSIARGEQHQMIFDAGMVEGYKKAIDTISEILAMRVEETKDPSND